MNREIMTRVEPRSKKQPGGISGVTLQSAFKHMGLG